MGSGDVYKRQDDGFIGVPFQGIQMIGETHVVCLPRLSHHIGDVDLEGITLNDSFSDAFNQQGWNDASE